MKHSSEMTEANVVYADVKFTKSKRDNTGETSSPAETTYPGVRNLNTKPSSELSAGSQQKAPSNNGSKVTSERVAIITLSVLLTAAAVALIFISFEYIQTEERLQQLTERYYQVTLHNEENTCPTGVNTTDPCSKCQEGWEKEEGQCYFFSTNLSNWAQAREECKQRGGDLVHNIDQKKQSFLERHARQRMINDEDKFWIGLTDSETENTWLWVDGSPLEESLSFWSKGQPDNWTVEDSNGEDCVRMGEKGSQPVLRCWLDKSCKFPQRSICEKPARPGHLICV